MYLQAFNEGHETLIEFASTDEQASTHSFRKLWWLKKNKLLKTKECLSIFSLGSHRGLPNLLKERPRR